MIGNDRHKVCSGTRVATGVRTDGDAHFVVPGLRAGTAVLTRLRAQLRQGGGVGEHLASLLDRVSRWHRLIGVYSSRSQEARLRPRVPGSPPTNLGTSAWHARP